MDFGKKKAADVNAEPSTIAAEPRQTTVIKKSRSAWSTVAFFFLLLLLIALGAIAWMYFMWQDSQNQAASSKTELTSAQATISSLREKIATSNGEASAQAQTPVNDEADIKTAAKNYNDSLANPFKNPKIEVAKKDGSQAIAMVSEGVAGYKLYLKKVNDTWMVVYSGQNVPPAEIVKQFDIKL